MTGEPAGGATKTAFQGGGYWLVGSDREVFAFGGAPFYGSTGNLHPPPLQPTDLTTRGNHE